jgi:pimeloyl-[acyl-carrier protein] methyl ester esterase
MAHHSTGVGQVYYEYHQGDPDLPCVVLVHGFGMSCRVWDQTTARLVDAGYPVLAVDQRCCGCSDKDFSDVSIETQAKDLVEICHEWNLDSIVLNGWSLGGAIAVAAAAQLESKVIGLVLTGGATPRYTQAEGFPHGGMPEDVLATVAALRANRAVFLKGLYYEGVFACDVDEAVKAWCWQLALQESPAGDAALAELAHIDQRDMMATLSCPALVIHGTDDGVVPIDIGRYAAEQLVKGALYEMAGCGHATFLEDSDSYHAALLGFLDEASR